MDDTITGITDGIDRLLYDLARNGNRKLLRALSGVISIHTGWPLGDTYHRLVAEVGSSAAEAFIRNRAQHYLNL